MHGGGRGGVHGGGHGGIHGGGRGGIHGGIHDGVHHGVHYGVHGGLGGGNDNTIFSAQLLESICRDNPSFQIVDDCCTIISDGKTIGSDNPEVMTVEEDAAVTRPSGMLDTYCPVWATNARKKTTKKTHETVMLYYCKGHKRKDKPHSCGYQVTVFHCTKCAFQCLH